MVFPPVQSDPNGDDQQRRRPPPCPFHVRGPTTRRPRHIAHHCAAAQTRVVERDQPSIGPWRCTCPPARVCPTTGASHIRARIVAASHTCRTVTTMHLHIVENLTLPPVVGALATAAVLVASAHLGAELLWSVDVRLRQRKLTRGTRMATLTVLGMINATIMLALLGLIVSLG
ncbi:hypothetical protein AERO9AM_10259 [Aeromicrobium sp. 9AM]|nr:hypothetical protein AERO9AM_10259 [Aeromicrobium sp. 9AM]